MCAEGIRMSWSRLIIVKTPWKSHGMRVHTSRLELSMWHLNILRAATHCAHANLLHIRSEYIHDYEVSDPRCPKLFPLSCPDANNFYSFTLMPILIGDGRKDRGGDWVSWIDEELTHVIGKSIKLALTTTTLPQKTQLPIWNYRIHCARLAYTRRICLIATLLLHLSLLVNLQTSCRSCYCAILHIIEH